MRRRALLMSAVLAFLWTPGLGQDIDIESFPPKAEMTDLYPPFDDGLPPNTLDVMELISSAASRNPELAAMRDNWRIAQALIPQMEAVPDPVFTAQYAQIPGFANPQFIHRGYVQVSLSQKLPGYGKIPARTRVAELEVEVRHRLYQELLNSILTEIQKKLVELYLVETQIQIKRKHQFMIDHLIRVTNIRYSVGKGAQPDVVRAQTERTRFESELSELWGRRKRILLRLKYLTGSDILPVGRAPVPAQPNEIELELENLLETAQLYRPQLWAIRTQIEKAEARRRLAETEDNPDVTLAIMSRWFEYRPDGIMLTASISLPFFNQRGYEYAVIEQEREIEKAESLLREALEKIEYGLGDKIVEIETANDRYKIVEDTHLLQAQQLFRGSLKSYETGEYDFNSLIRAQHTLQEVELLMIKLETEASLAFAEIEGMVGIMMVPAYQFPNGRMP
jgi:outer membrane protein, heavy metal efflux system